MVLYIPPIHGKVQCKDAAHDFKPKTMSGWQGPCGHVNGTGAKFCGGCGSPAPVFNAQPVAQTVSPMMVQPMVQQPMAQAVAQPVVQQPMAQAVAQPVVAQPVVAPARSMPPAAPQDECCSCCSETCMGVILLIVGILGLLNLVWSIPCIMLGSYLVKCCCVDSDPKCLGCCVAVLSGIYMGASLVGGLMFAGTADAICAGIFGVELGVYSFYKEEFTIGCDICQDRPSYETCGGSEPSGAAAACGFCDLMHTLPLFIIIEGVAFYLPSFIIGIIVSCRKPKATRPVVDV